MTHNKMAHNIILCHTTFIKMTLCKMTLGRTLLLHNEYKNKVILSNGIQHNDIYHDSTQIKDTQHDNHMEYDTQHNKTQHMALKICLKDNWHFAQLHSGSFTLAKFVKQNHWQLLQVTVTTILALSTLGSVREIG